jgi:transposase
MNKNETAGKEGETRYKFTKTNNIRKLEYEVQAVRDRLKELRIADRFFPSSKLCSCCGAVKKDLKLSDRVYRCECGNVIDRDYQASINLFNSKIYKAAV